jgi:hypothetical protein
MRSNKVGQMATQKSTKSSEVQEKVSNQAIECGVVMPISATSNHDGTHWARVQTLLHRGIRDAGLVPKNVWTDSAVDRITPRILNNLFAVTIAVCDISDLNPNVMLELGMRLTSKKPTVIVAEKGSTIPFDIKDFEALIYPNDLNILDMEVFFEQLKHYLQERVKSYQDGHYQPFLKDVDFEFLEPAGRAVPFENLVETRLDRIMMRLESLSPQSSRIDSSQEKVRFVKHKIQSQGLLVELDGEITHEISEVDQIIEDKTQYKCTIISPKMLLVPIPLPVRPGMIREINDALVAAGVKANIESVQLSPLEQS